MGYTRNYEDAKDIHVRNYVLYAKASDNYVYSDKELKNKLSASELTDLFFKGLMIEEGGITYAANSIKDNKAKGVAVTYVKSGTSNAGTIVTVNSEEYTV